MKNDKKTIYNVYPEKIMLSKLHETQRSKRTFMSCVNSEDPASAKYKKQDRSISSASQVPTQVPKCNGRPVNVKTV